MLFEYAPNETDIENLHDQTLALLARTGVRLCHQEARDLFQKAGAKIDGETVKIPPILVEQALTSVAPAFSLRARNEENSIVVGEGRPVFGPTVGVVFVSDPKQGRRHSTAKDHEDLLKLSQTSPYCALACAGLIYPDAYRGKEGLIQQMKNALLLSDKPVLALTQDQEIAEITLAMAALSMGDEGCYAMGICNTLSPLAWDEKMLGALMAFARAGQPVVAACCSILGLTSPIGIAETVVVNNAEVLAGVILTQLVREGTPVVYGNTSAAVDMRTMAIALGAPEYAQIEAIGRALARRYGLPYRSGGGLTDAKVVDAQAGVESALNLAVAVANHNDLIFHALGSMESFLSVSYEKWLLDEETLGRLVHMTASPAPAADTPALAAEVGIMGSYLTHPTTFAQYKAVLHTPPLANRDNYESWAAKDTSLLREASRLIASRINAYEQPPTDKKIAAKLNRF